VHVEHFPLPFEVPVHVELQLVQLVVLEVPEQVVTQLPVQVEEHPPIQLDEQPPVQVEEHPVEQDVQPDDVEESVQLVAQL
jgi:hypothetical protein